MKPLTWLLRHGALEAGLRMDAAGWCDVADLCELTGLTPTELADVVADDRKQRFQLEAMRMRACQGHTPAGTPVTAAALEASWQPWEGPRCWHGTTVDAAVAIAASGLHPMDRSHVHLAPAPDATVGKRASVAVLLELDSAAVGGPIWRAPNGVLLARHVRAEAVVALHLCTKAARRRAHELVVVWPGPPTGPKVVSRP